MESFLYYLCCCGLCCAPKFVKTTDQKQKKKTIKQLTAITPESSLKSEASSPSSMKTEEMSDIHKIPDEFETPDDVLVSYGFTRGNEIGSGYSAVVYKAYHIKTGFIIAVKVCQMPKERYKLSKDQKKKRLKVIKGMKNELFVLQTIRHPHIIQLIRHFMIVQKHLTSLYILIRYAEHGDMSAFLKKNGPFDENLSKLWFAQMLSALVYMHSKGYAHRDLKLGNILLDSSDDVLISDFGLSQVIDFETDDEPLESTTYCGTPQYMAPEILEKKVNRKQRNVPYDPFLADVWSLGVILYNLLNKSHPFEVNGKNPRTRAKAFKKMKEKKWSFSSNMLSPASPPLQQMMKQILEPDPKSRPKMIDLTQHQWVSDDYKKVEIECKKWMKMTDK